MATLFLVTGCLAVVFFCLGLYIRRRVGRRNNPAIWPRLAWDSMQLGFAVVGTITVGWLLISTIRNGGAIGQNLPPGVQEDAILGILIVGTFLGAVYTVTDYAKHLGRPRRRRS